MERSAKFEGWYLDCRRSILKAVYEMLGDWAAAEQVAAGAFRLMKARLDRGDVLPRPKAYVWSRAHLLALHSLQEGRCARPVPDWMLVPLEPADL
jgi:hypothetical protein